MTDTTSPTPPDWRWVQAADLRPGMVVIADTDLDAGRCEDRVITFVDHDPEGVAYGWLDYRIGMETCHPEDRRSWAWIAGDWWEVDHGGVTRAAAAWQLARLALAPPTSGRSASAASLARHVLGLDPVTTVPDPTDRHRYDGLIAHAVTIWQEAQ